MAWFDRCKMPAVERADRRAGESLCGRNDRGVGCAEREAGVGLDELGDPRPVVRRRCLDVEVLQRREKAGLGARPKSCPGEVDDLGNSKRG
jgi:hypothetical protein